MQRHRNTQTNEGGRNVLDVAFMQHYVRHMYDFGFHYLKVRPLGPLVPMPTISVHSMGMNSEYTSA